MSKICKALLIASSENGHWRANLHMLFKHLIQSYKGRAKDGERRWNEMNRHHENNDTEWTCFRGMGVEYIEMGIVVVCYFTFNWNANINLMCCLSLSQHLSWEIGIIIKCHLITIDYRKLSLATIRVEIAFKELPWEKQLPVVSLVSYTQLTFW